MHVTGCRSRVLLLLCLAAGVSVTGQQPDASDLVITGQVTVEGRQMPYQIRHLPPSSFQDMPLAIAAALTQRGCLIPQTYEAHRPENVIHGSFERAGSADWAVLCSSGGAVSLLVFFGSMPGQPVTLATAPETERLQTHPSSQVLGFNWGIDPATPQAVHVAQIGLSPRPPTPDHDALADSVIDHKTIYRYFKNGTWGLVDLPD
ncbi:MAG TPA: hypothetical protein VGJ21_12370 [Terracidiphilus sp.]|jgi:hypothetical protein